jgi:hypothetical protein
MRGRPVVTFVTDFGARDAYVGAMKGVVLRALGELGEQVADWVRLDVPAPRLAGDGGVLGEVIHVDRFGNLVTNLGPRDLPAGIPTFAIAGREVRGLSRCYADVGPGALVALVGSTGRIEVSVRDGSAAGALGRGVAAGRGEAVRVTGA